MPYLEMSCQTMTILFVDEDDGHYDVTKEYVSGTLYYREIYVLLLYILPTG